MNELLRRNLIPLIVATALFMENLDATVLATSLPAIAKDIGANPINLKLALTTYLLALAIFIPASGWMADRFGAKNIFRAAMVVFAAGSIACALSTGLGSLVAARVLQGMGGAMMTPVGRLIVLRTVPRTEIIGAIAWLSIPALVGPVLGPPLGGFITTYFNWRWIFWINIPVALAGIALITRYIPDVREEAPKGFDLRGFLLIGPGLSMFLTGVTLLGLGLVTQETVVAVIFAGAALLAAYVWHALRTPEPIIDLKLLAIPTFRAGVVGGFLFRTGLGAGPFLLPLLFQAGFGMTAFQSGMLTFATGVGSLFMKTQVSTDPAQLWIPPGFGLQRAHRGAVRRGTGTVYRGNVAAADYRFVSGRWFVALAAVHQHQYAGLCRRADGTAEPRDELCGSRSEPGGVGRRHDRGARPRGRRKDNGRRKSCTHAFSAGVHSCRGYLGIIGIAVHATSKLGRRLASADGRDKA